MWGQPSSHVINQGSLISNQSIDSMCGPHTPPDANNFNHAALQFTSADSRLSVARPGSNPVIPSLIGWEESNNEDWVWPAQVFVGCLPSLYWVTRSSGPRPAWALTLFYVQNEIEKCCPIHLMTSIHYVHLNSQLLDNRGVFVFAWHVLNSIKFFGNAYVRQFDNYRPKDL